MRAYFFRLTAVVLMGLTLSGLFTGYASTRSLSAQDDQRVDGLLQRLTIEEKIELIGGDTPFRTHPIERLGIPFFQMADGPSGAHIPAPTIAYAAGIGLAATWDTDLAEQVGRQLGRDARSRGAAFLLGPGVNIYRTPLNGRNFEYFGEDPFLGGKIAVGYIQGVQSRGVAATVKHFLGNNSEYDRHRSNSVIDERAIREIYAPIFEASVKEAHVGAIMDSYNLTNGAHMSESPLNVSLIKGDWKFPGLIMSDWVSLYSTLGPANNGLDLEMPYGDYFAADKLLPLLKSGKIAEATLDDKVRRLLRTALRFDWLNRPQLDASIPRYNLEGRQAALVGATEAAVLLKNEGKVLPLKKATVRTIALIGPNATPAFPTGGGSGEVVTFDSSSLLTGLTDALGGAGRVLYARGLYSVTQLARLTSYSRDKEGQMPGVSVQTFNEENLKGDVQSTATQSAILVYPTTRREPEEQELNALMAHKAADPYRGNGTSSQWKGFYQASRSTEYVVFVQTDANFRFMLDGQVIFDNASIPKAILNQTRMHLERGAHSVQLDVLRSARFGTTTPVLAALVPVDAIVDPAAKEMASKADAVVIAAGFNSRSESEGGDRGYDLPVGQEELIHEIAPLNKSTVVTIISGGSVNVSRWQGEVPAIFELWYPGERGGEAFAKLLFGDANPSGHLPITWDRNLTDNPSYPYYYPEAGSSSVKYGESIFVGYRGYEHASRQPQYPFGFGLSYTTFKYSNMSVERLSEGRFRVECDVQNTGERTGATVAQLYVAEKAPSVARPPKELKAFARVELAPGEQKRVQLLLAPRSFAYYDVARKHWRADAGTYALLLGQSSQEIALNATVTMPRALDIPVDAAIY
jgi:beta-glucosidase